MNQTEYTPHEILAYLQADYKQRTAYDIVPEGYELQFETTIEDWIDLCDLFRPKELWVYLNQTFKMNLPGQEWLTVLKPARKKTLEDLCQFIAKYAERLKAPARNLLGNKCKSAGIFKTLVEELKERGNQIEAIRPSSSLEPIIFKCGGDLIEIVNLLNPYALPKMDFEESKIYKLGFRILIMTFPLSFTFALLFHESVTIIGTLTALFIGYLFVWYGSKMNPQKARFEGIETISDLVKRIETAVPA